MSDNMEIGKTQFGWYVYDINRDQYLWAIDNKWHDSMALKKAYFSTKTQAIGAAASKGAKSDEEEEASFWEGIY